ncbi:MAG: alanine racemase [Bradyrhizobiaceae bacterium]|nr:alanine racemase [Bradyrhizobiaceae bacterium]
MRSTTAVINLDHLRSNLAVIKQKAHGRGICAMVKANAYGHGMVQCAKVLEAEGVDFLGVALVDEAVVLRQAGIRMPILVLTPNEPQDAALAVTHGLTMVICSMEQARVLNAAAKDTKVGGHVFVDTGMHRDGFPFQEVHERLDELAQLENLELTGICTHLATTDVADDAFIQEQLERFSTVLKNCADRGRTFACIHAANTGAVWQTPESLFTLVRPGISLYGYASPLDPSVQLHPVMSITSRVISLRRLWPGETVSYGRRYAVDRPTTIATIPIGYGDGYSRSLSNKAHCVIDGKRYPVVGTVCMDEIMVDVGDDPIEVGSLVHLLGEQTTEDGSASVDANDLAQWAETIPYEITTMVGPRIPRTFIGGRGQ